MEDIGHRGESASNSSSVDQGFSIINVEEDGDFYILVPLGRDNRSLALNVTDSDAASSSPSEDDLDVKAELKKEIVELFRNSFKLRSTLSERKRLNINKTKSEVTTKDEEFWFSHLVKFLPYSSESDRPFSLVPDSSDSSAHSGLIKNKIEIAENYTKEELSNQNDLVPVKKLSVPFLREKVQIPKKSVPFQREKVQMSKESVPFQREKVQIPKESVPFQREKVQISKEAIPFRREKAKLPKEAVPFQREKEKVPKESVPIRNDLGSGTSKKGKTLFEESDKQEIKIDTSVQGKIGLPWPTTVTPSSSFVTKMSSQNEIFKPTETSNPSTDFTHSNDTRDAVSSDPKFEFLISQSDDIESLSKTPEIAVHETGIPLPPIGSFDFHDTPANEDEIIKELDNITITSDYDTDGVVNNADYTDGYVLNDNDYVNDYDMNDIDYIAEDPTDEEEIETFDIEDFDPAHFGLPNINMAELSEPGGIPLPDTRKSKSLRMDNKTATFIFILLNSLSDAMNFNNSLNSFKSSALDGSAKSISSPPINSFLHSFDSRLLDASSLTPLQDENQSSPLISSNRGKVLPSSFPTTERSTFVRLFQEIHPTMSALCHSEPSCDNDDFGFCLKDSDYPVKEMTELASRDQDIVFKYAEVTKQSANDLVSILTKAQEESFNYTSFNPGSYDKSHWFGPDGYICPSNVTYENPSRAQNARGEWRLILNDGDVYTQTLRIEVCLFPKTPCRLIAPCFKSRCLQKYTYHRLLALDPCQPSKGLHVDIFRLPSACSCYAPAFHGFGDDSIDELLLI